jgi:O-antigen/teichoic acid export membrane protein
MNVDKKKSIRVQSLSKRAVKGGMWMVGLKFTHRGLGLLRTFILARLLSPEDFGLFGLALLALSFVDNFSVTGISNTLIQKRENIQDYLDTAWTVQLLRAFLLFAILFSCAQPVALFFKRPEVVDILRAIAFVVLFTGIENIGTIYFQKEIRFEKVFLLKFCSILMNLTVSIAVALILKNVWALVYGSLAGALTKLLLSYMVHPYRPRLKFDFVKFRELLRLGKWFFGSSILVFLITEGDDAVVGKILGATALGFYQMAYLISNSTATEISNFVASLMFPVYSKLQDNPDTLREAYLRVFQLVTFIVFPIAGLIFILSPDFTYLFLGEKWMPMVPALQILTIWGVIRSVEATTIQIFYATGRPDYSTKILLLEALIIMALIYPLTAKWGILGASLTIVAAGVIPNLTACYMALKIVKSNGYDFGKILVLPLINTFVMLFAISVAQSLGSGATIFFANIFVGVTVYVAVTIFFRQFFDYDVWYVLHKAWCGVNKANT